MVGELELHVRAADERGSVDGDDGRGKRGENVESRKGREGGRITFRMPRPMSSLTKGKARSCKNPCFNKSASALVSIEETI